MPHLSDFQFDESTSEHQPDNPLETMVQKFVKQSKVKIPPIEDGAMAPKCANCKRRRKRTGPCWYCADGAAETFDEEPVSITRPAP